MPLEVQKEVTTTSQGVASDQVSQTATVAQVPTGAEAQDAQSDRGNAWIWYIIGIIDLLLVLRLILSMFGARTVGFAAFIYNITSPLVAPFRGIFPNSIGNGSYFDMAALVAIIVYILVGWAISRLIDLVTRPASSKKV